MSSTLPARRAARRPVPAGPRGWRSTALALAAALTLGLAAAPAQALSLGRATVQSALGEPLRAEIDIPQITPDEIATLRTALGSPEAFRAAGMERSAALADLQISLQQRANGSYFLRLASDRAVNEPFIDLVLEASGPAGRIVREYTLLLDPPSLRQAAPVAPPTPLPAQVAPVAPPPVAEAPPAPAPAPAPAPVAAPAASVPAPVPAAAASKPQRRVTVQTGQTAAGIAAAAKPSTVSLDQMLVSLLRTNPDAFVGGNVNRLKAGAVLELPSEAEAAAVGAAEARQTVVAQSKDFNEFKQRLAAGVNERPAAAGTGTPGRTATGQVQARVEEKKPAPATPDRLTLSKGAIEEGSRDGKASEDRIARERAEREAASRTAELDRNIAELKRLGTESATLAAPPATAASAAASSASAAADPAGIAVPSTLPTPGAAADTASAAASAAAPASSPASATVTAAAAPATAEDSGLMDLLSNPWLPAAVGAVLALLLALALYRRQQARKLSASADPDAAADRLPPDSFFGGSGGQRIDTSEGGNSMLYSPSQIDAAGDVDPVAEADVYLAYGRDLQAEEILREALRATPQRVAIHAKLLEILARRHDAEDFEEIARDAHALTGGSGPQWAQIASLGLELDPGNPLYAGAGSPEPSFAPAPMPAPAPAPAPAPKPAPATPPGLDLDISSFQPRPAPAPMNETAGSPFDFSDEEAGPAPAARADASAADFDLAGLSLDLDTPADSGSAPAGAEALATKLSLAEEFHAIGDVDGARSLVREVLAEADGDLRERAERLLAELG